MSQKHAIRLPGLLLDELKAKDYDNDERFNSGKDYSKGKKKASKGEASRKERRKQSRLNKKSSGKSKQGLAARLDVKTGSQRHSSGKNEIYHRKEIRGKKSDVNPKNEGSLLLPPDDELSSDDFEEFDDGDLDEEEWKELRELEEEDNEMDRSVEEDQEAGNFSSGESNDDDDIGLSEDNIDEVIDGDDQKEMTVEETMSALKALKERKRRAGIPNATQEHKQETKLTIQEEEKGNDAPELNVEETMEALKRMKQNKNKLRTSNPSHRENNDKKRRKEEDIEVEYPIAPADRAAIERDEMDMQYYAKKLGMKGKYKRLHARDEYDAIGGLLDGLDFIDNYGVNDEEYGEYGGEAKNSYNEQPSDSVHSSENEGSDRNLDNRENYYQMDDEELNMLPSDDELSSGDFDEFDENDLDEGEWEQLRELEQSADEDDNSRKRENPLVAPLAPDTYVPPSMRKKTLITGGDSVIELEINKRVKSSLNKLSDSNIAIIISSLNELYDSYPRQYVTDAISRQTVDILGQRNKLLTSFVMNYAAVAFALWRLRGTEYGACFIQLSIETFLEHLDKGIKAVCETQDSEKDAPHVMPKQASNILSLISYTYNFGLISCNLVYDLIRLLIASPNEFTTELLLTVISISGPLIRGDDPSALKEIISQLLLNVKGVRTQSPRLKFLLDTMSDLKNNRLKASLLAANHQSLKKTLQNSLQGGTTSSEPILVTLDDIKNVDNKGKWWLIGASWKGNMDGHPEELQSNNIGANKTVTKKLVIQDDLLDDIPDWSEIARQQRMNTDVRRAIFISIMSAQDYMDAFGRLEKLNLKNKQSLEIPRVLVHCLSQDSGINGYNPYYALLAVKLCENQHNLVKPFQFLFWDITKSFEEEKDDDAVDGEEFHVDEDTRLRSIANKGKFFGHLLAEGVLQLDIFKHVSLITGLVADGIIFVEFLLYELLQTVAKKSEVKEKNAKGKKTISCSYKDDALIKLLENGIKLENRSVILKGLLYFTKKNLKYKGYLSGAKGSKAYARDLRRMEYAIPKFIETVERNLESIII